MFADNEKISLKQLRRLIVFDLFSVSFFIIPRIGTVAAGRDGILSIVLAFLFGILYVCILMAFSKGISGSFLEYSRKNAGGVITFIVGILFLVKLFACCVFAVRLFGDVINETLLEDTDHKLILFMLLAVSAYAASKGFENRARITEMLYYIVIIPIFLFLLLGLRKLDYTNLFPVFTESTGTILSGGYQIFLTFSLLEMLLFAIPFVSKTHRKEKDTSTSEEELSGTHKKEKGVFRYVMDSLVIVTILDVLFFVVTVGILGVEETGQKLWSSVTIIQIIKMPGSFIQRQDAIILSFWMLSIFTVISGFLYYISLISKDIFRVSRQNYLLIPFLIFLFAASVIPIDTEQYFYYFEKYMMYVGMPQSILLPAFVLLVGKSRKKGGSKKPKAALLILVLLSAVTFTGCSDMTEIEDRNFVQAMGIDLKGGEFSIGYQLPDLQALTGQSNTEPDKLMVKLTGDDFLQMEDIYGHQSSKKLDFSHLKAIILGKSLAEDPKKLEEFILYAKNKYELARNTLIFLSDTSAGDILDLSGNLTGGTGDYLHRLYEVNLQKSGREEVTVGDLIQSYMNKNRCVRIPVLKVKEKTVESAGLAVFSEKRILYTLPEETSVYVNIACGFGKNSLLFIKGNGENGQETNTKKPIEYVVKLSALSRKLDYSWVDGKPFLAMKISGNGVIEKGLNNDTEVSKTINTELVSKIQQTCNEQIKSEIDKTLETVMKGAKADFMNLYRLTSYKKRSIWLDYKGKESQFIEDLGYSLEVNITLK